MIDHKIEISDEQVAFFKENGFLQLPHLFSPEEVKQIKALLLRAMEKHREHYKSNAESIANNENIDEETRRNADLYAKVFDQRVNLWKVDEEMRRFTCNPHLAEAVRRVGGLKGLRLWHDQALVKPARDSRASNWHQDTPYWPMAENGGLSLWIALDDVDDRNGCMWFVPKSRDLGRLNSQSLVMDDPESLLKLPELQGKLQPPVCMAMEAGGATIHDGLTFHYANANRTDAPRHAFAILYMPDGATYNGAYHVCTDGKDLIVGQPIAGEDFPLLAVEEHAGVGR
jgi:ectoine hydroxylase-related dioxygenase (phytanoyl-CoA dioxygenase family)